MKIQFSRKGGFTLVELLVVIAIIGILASLLLPVLSRAKQSAYTTACLSNLHQMGLALNIYVEENNNHLPSCPMIPSQDTNLTPIFIILKMNLQNPKVWHCPADQTLFQTEGTSYEWNYFLNGASYDRPEDWLPSTQTIVNVIFGGRYTTPLIGDANSFHPMTGMLTGRNALYFDGRVEKTKMSGFESIAAP